MIKKRRLEKNYEGGEKKKRKKIVAPKPLPYLPVKKKDPKE